MKPGLNELCEALERRIARSGDFPLTHASFVKLLRIVLSGQPEKFYDPPPPIPQQFVRPDYPKLLIRWELSSGVELERKWVNNIIEHKPFMAGGWYPASEADYARAALEDATKKEQPA